MQRADVYQPIEASQAGPPPLVIRVVTTAAGQMVVGGTPSSSRKVEPYVLLSALPEELRLRVELAIQALIQGG